MDKALGDPDRFLNFVGNLLAGGRTDVIHDLLAFLVERMTALKKDKQIVAREFLTDGLVDQIVYRLYGLTEDEIQLVEEGTKP